MKLLTGWIMSAGLVLTATAVNAQPLAPHQIGGAPYVAASDFDGPYAAIPSEPPAPRYGAMLLPAPEVYAIVRESGFSPLGSPHLRGLVYTIAAIDRGGEDGRLVIDARTGRIIRFMPAYRMGGGFNEEMPVTRGPVGALRPISPVAGVPRPPAPIPRLASRTPSVPMPKAPPQRPGEARSLASGPAQQSAAVQAKPEPATTPQAAAPPVEARPATPQILPTQEMPKVQGLE